MSYTVFKKDGVWKHFLRSSDTNNARCTLCPSGKIIKCAGGSTSGIRTHLKSQHPTEFASLESEPQPPPAKKMRTLDDFVRRNDQPSLEYRLSRMIAKDGLSFKTVAESEDIQFLLRAKYDRVPTSRAIVHKLVTKFAHRVTARVKDMLAARKSEQAKFCLTFDEWTSVRNRRYMNVCLTDHTSQGRVLFNLGLLRITGSMPADRCLQLLSNLLEEYGLEMSDIFAFCTDGAPLMTRVGKDAGVLHQLCLAHGIHLAVCDVMYPKTANKHCTPDTSSESDDDDGDFIDDDEEDDDDDDVDVEFTQEAVTKVISKVRSIASLFKKSPQANDKLQFFVREAHKKELVLIRDVKTRWNSLYDMLERFLCLHTCVEQTLLALQKPPSFTAAEIDIIRSVCAVLQPLNVAVTRLNRRDVTLVTAKQITDFVGLKLHSKASEKSATAASIANELLEARNSRMAGRATLMTQILDYLQGGHGSVLTQSQIKKFIVDLLRRANYHFPKTHDDRPDAGREEIAEVGIVEEDFEMELENFIATQQKAANVVAVEPPLERLVTKELETFKLGGNPGDLLKLVTGWLLSVPPTSVECERAFSVAGNFGTKVRNRLNDDTLDVLAILKWYFKQDLLHVK